MKIVWQIGKRVAGGSLMLLGVVGLFLPGLQGILMIVLGAYLLGYERGDLIAGLAFVERRFPRWSAMMARLRAKLER